MKIKVYLVLSIFISLFFISCGSKKSNNKINMKNFTLANGLEVYTENNSNSNNVSILFCMRDGRYLETFETCGLLHLYEHMTLKANSVYDSCAVMTKELNSNGGHFNAETSESCLTFYLTVDKNDLERALYTYNAAIRSPLFIAEEFEIEKQIVLTEMKGRINSYASLYDLMDYTLFPECPGCIVNYINDESILNATLEDMYFIKNNFFNPSNVALYIFGNFDDKKIKKTVNEIFGSWKDYEQIESVENKRKEYNLEISDTPYVVIEKDNGVTNRVVDIKAYYKVPGSKVNFELFNNFLYLYLLGLYEEENFFDYEASDIQSILVPSLYNKKYSIYNFVRTFNITELNKTQIEEYYDNFALSLYNNILAHKELFTPEYIKEIQNKFIDAINTVFPVSNLDKAKYFGDLENYLGKENLYKLFNEEWNVSQEKALEYVNKYLVNENPLKVYEVYEKDYITYKPLIDSYGFTFFDSKESEMLKNHVIENNIGKGALSHGDVKYAPDVFVMPFSLEKNISDFSNVKIKETYLNENVPLTIINGKNYTDFSICAYSNISKNDLKKEYSNFENVLVKFISKTGTKYSSEERNKFYEENQAFIKCGTSPLGFSVEISSPFYKYKDVLDYYTDSIFNASINSEIIRSEILRIKDIDYNRKPGLYAYNKMMEDFSLEHGYENLYDSSYESYKNINIQNIQKFYDEYFFDFSKLGFVICGNFSNKDISYIKKILNSKINEISKSKIENEIVCDGSFYKNDVDFEIFNFPKINIIENADCGDVSFIYRSYEVPGCSNFKDFISYYAARILYAEKLNEFFRLKYNRCYSTYCDIEDFNYSDVSLGYDEIYFANDISDYENIFEEIKNDILNNMDYEVEMENIKNELRKHYLDYTKASLRCMSSYFTKVLYGDANYYFNNANVIENLSWKDVKESMEEYILSDNCRYYISTGFAK